MINLKFSASVFLDDINNIINTKIIRRHFIFCLCVINFLDVFM